MSSKNKLNNIAKYLASQGFYKEAASLKKVAANTDPASASAWPTPMEDTPTYMTTEALERTIRLLEDTHRQMMQTAGPEYTYEIEETLARLRKDLKNRQGEEKVTVESLKGLSNQEIDRAARSMTMEDFNEMVADLQEEKDEWIAEGNADERRGKIGGMKFEFEDELFYASQLKSWRNKTREESGYSARTPQLVARPSLYRE